MRFLYLFIFSFSILSAGGGILDVDWSSVTPKSGQQKASAPYPKVLTEGIKDVHLPVYLSSRYIYDKSMSVVSDKDFYTISIDLQDAVVTFQGDRTFQESVAPSNPEFKKIEKETPPVDYNSAEGIMSATFNRHGVNYRINVECEEPKKDKRCKETTLISSLYNSLVMVGGRP